MRSLHRRVLLQASSSVSGLCSRRVFIHEFHATATACASRPVKLARGVSTKKSFADLPSAWILPDGTPAKPLDDWHGGLGQPVNIKISKPDVSPKASNLDAAIATPPARRGRPKATRQPRTTAEATPSINHGEAIETPISNHGTFEPTTPATPLARRGRPKRARASTPTDTLKAAVEPVTKAIDDKTASPPAFPPKRTRRRRVAVVKPQDEPELLPVSRQETETDSPFTKPLKTRTRRKKATALEGASEDAAAPAPRTVLSQEIHDNLARFPDCLLLTRVGQFYESYYDQAPLIASLLNIKSTSRAWAKGRVPMCGFPLMHLDRHLKTLVQTHGRNVAICEEFPRPRRIKVQVNMKVNDDGEGQGEGEVMELEPLTFERRVVRIVTPGTLIDEPFLDQHENNYLLAITVSEPATNFNLRPELGSDSATGTGAGAALQATKEPQLGLAWIDVSTGEFFSKSTTQAGIRDEIVRLTPREVVLDRSFESLPDHPLRQVLTEEQVCVSYIDDPAHSTISQEASNSDDSQDSSKLIPTGPLTINSEISTNSDDLTETSISAPSPSSKDSSQSPTAISTASTYTPSESTAIALLTSFLSTHLMEHMPTLGLPRRTAESAHMSIDASTLTALEIKARSYGNTEGSLLAAVRRTLTPGGARLLARWLCAPSTSLPETAARQAAVALFHSRPHLRVDLRQVVRTVPDATRLLQKLAARRGTSADLVGLQTAMGTWRMLRRRVELEKTMEERERGGLAEEWNALVGLMERMDGLEKLEERISLALQNANTNMDDLETSSTGGAADDGRELSQTSSSVEEQDPVFSAHGQWSIKPEFSQELSTLHTRLRALLDQRVTLERHLQMKFMAPSLTLRSARGYGMHVHVGRIKKDAVLLRAHPDFVKLSETGSTMTFFFKEWSVLGSQIIETSSAIFAAERDAFEQLRTEINAQSAPLRRNARVVDELDVTLGFADLADEMRWVRPELTEEPTYHVENGRHPTVELGLLTAGRVFTPNTVSFSPGSSLHIITGPNMAGKSTLLRQTALIALLAQVGSFVPADSARLGIADQLFARVGAKDDLFRDRSTFMVEMLETAEILRRATSRSLVIMDEVGRGTTVQDGLAIAFGTIAYLHGVNQCRTLFATHFHELADMLGYAEDGRRQEETFAGIDFFCTDVQETEDGFFSYSHRLRPGVTRDSHGIKVAQLANMPPHVIATANAVIARLRAEEALTARAHWRQLGQDAAAVSPAEPLPLLASS